MNKYLSVMEVASLLGKSPAAIRQMCCRRQIPYRKLPGLGVRFKGEELDRWIENAEGVRLEDLTLKRR